MTRKACACNWAFGLFLLVKRKAQGVARLLLRHVAPKYFDAMFNKPKGLHHGFKDFSTHTAGAGDPFSIADHRGRFSPESSATNAKTLGDGKHRPGEVPANQWPIGMARGRNQSTNGGGVMWPAVTCALLRLRQMLTRWRAAK